MMLTKKICQIYLGILPILGFAQECCPVVPGEPLQGDQVCPGYFYPAQYEVASCLEISISADFIYWTAGKQLNAIAFEDELINNGTGVHHNVIIHKPGYHPGFKVGLGIGLPCFDHVSLNSEYVWYNHTSTKTHEAGLTTALLPVTGIAQGPPFSAAPRPFSSRVRSKWDLSLNIAQLTLNRPFYIGKRIIINPGFGLKAFWFDEKQSIIFDLRAGGLGTERSHFKSWAVGPYAYANVKGLLCYDLYFIAKFGFLSPYQRHTKDLFQANFPFTGTDQSDFDFGSRKPYTFEPYMESELGLGWGRYFCGCSYHADIAITYEYYATLFLFLANIGGPMPKDHWFHGLTVKGQFNF
ncbi:MAG: hypothetical protein JSS30_06480 [Verrucomicrobia bacterium]|nr:hypothetical protein [Verrucomicrobiota bacterium]